MQQIRNLPSQGYPLGGSLGAIPSKYPAVCLWHLREFVECTTVAFDDAVANLFQVYMSQNNGAAVSTLKRQRPDRANGLSACDL